MTNAGFNGFPPSAGGFTQSDQRYPQIAAAEGLTATVTAAAPRIVPGGRLASHGSATLTTSRLFLVGFTASLAQSVTQIAINSRGTASSGITLARLGLYSVDSASNVTLLARTANDTSLCGSTFTNYVRSFDTTGGYAASVPLTQGARYALAVLFVGTTAPLVYGCSLGPVMSLASPFLAGAVATQSDLAASYASTAIVADGTFPSLQVY